MNNTSSLLWTFPQASQVQVTTKINPNNNYQTISKDFIEKYASAITFGINCAEYYYSSNASVSLHIHQGSNNYLHEIIGHANFKNKLSEFNINVIKFSNLVYTSQPVGKNSILLIFNGKADINNNTFTIINTFVLRIINGSPKIMNQVFEIFTP